MSMSQFPYMPSERWFLEAILENMPGPYIRRKIEAAVAGMYCDLYQEMEKSKKSDTSTDHVYFNCKCNKSGYCQYCDGGLKFCINCKGGEAELSESCLSRMIKRANELESRPVPAAPGGDMGKYCHLCYVGFPLYGGVHRGSQSHGMIPDTPCLAAPPAPPAAGVSEALRDASVDELRTFVQRSNRHANEAGGLMSSACRAVNALLQDRRAALVAANASTKETK